MEDPFKQLPEILNQGRLKNIGFKDHHRQQVLKKVQELNKPPAPKSWMYHWFHQSLSLALGIVFIFVFIQFAQSTPMEKKEAVTLSDIPYANQAILTKARHDMRNHHQVSDITARQYDDTLTVYITFPGNMEKDEQISLTESYLKEVSHLTLNEPYVSQVNLGDLWKYVNVNVYTTSSNEQLMAARLGIDMSYDWIGTMNTGDKKMTWEPISKENQGFQTNIR
jgi:hypothetical protein